jgi:hypothetical protein
VAADFDEAFDATWLTLEAMGFEVKEHDRRGGTLATGVVAAEHGTGRGWQAEISQEGARPTVTLLPHLYEDTRDVTGEAYWTLEGPGGELEKWDALFGRIAALVEAWRVHPELKLDTGRGELDAAGLRLLVPPSWEHFDFAVDRRTLIAQRFKRISGVNPTVLYRIERRRPEPDADALLHEALQRALAKSQDVIEPGEWDARADSWGVSGTGEVLLGPGHVPEPVRWRRWEARSPQWVVRVVAVCAPEGERACDFETHQLLESAADSNGRLVNPGGAVPGFQSR